VQHLAAMQLPEDFEDARDLSSHERLGPSPRLVLQKGAEVAVARVLEREAVQHLLGGAHQWKRVEDANRARMIVEELPKVGLTQPSVQVRTDFDADDLGYYRRTSDPSRRAR
jgi:hypothetical protein